MTETDLTGDRRCWPCTVANTAVGLVIGWVPFAAALLDGSQTVVWVTIVWGAAVTAYTAYRLLSLGYLPYSERIARRTGLHDRIGPGRKDDDEDYGEL